LFSCVVIPGNLATGIGAGRAKQIYSTGDILNRRDFIKLSAAAMIVPSVAWTVSPDLPRLPIGMNLAGIADWEPGFPFRNLMWGARLWLTHDVHQGGKWETGMIDRIPLDENGYPLELPVVIHGVDKPQTVFTLLPNVRSPGRYVLLYDGEGDFEGLMNTKILKKSPGRVLLQMRHAGGNPNDPDPGQLEGIWLSRSKYGNHVRNMRIVSISDEHVDIEKDPFLPEFLEFCRPFHALRFMDWMVTNGSLEKDWVNRKKRSFYTMVGAGGDADKFYGAGVETSVFLLSGGVAIEICIELCNRLGIDAWFNVPHRATDDYIEQFALLVKDKLDSRLKVYLEFSNEIWNWGFIQAQWMLSSEIAAAPLERDGLNPWNDKKNHKGKDHPERTGVLFRRCFAIWEKVFSGADRRRLVRVCAVQHAWLDTAQRTLKYCMQHGGADALSPAGYFAPGPKEYAHWKERGAALTADEVIADLKIVLERDTSKWTRELAVLARSYKVDLLIYEGGQHVQPEGQQELPYMPALAAAQKHQGMYDLYMQNFRLHKEVGCKLFCALSSVGRQGTRWGSWGHAERYGQPQSETTKLRALLDCNVPRNL
jgi:hypothetical protein